MQYDRPRAETLEAVEAALGRVGKVLEVSSATSTITGRVRCGLQSVKLRVAVLDGASSSSSIVEIAGSSDDLWGAGARKGADRLVRALES